MSGGVEGMVVAELLTRLERDVQETRIAATAAEHEWQMRRDAHERAAQAQEQWKRLILEQRKADRADKEGKR